MSLENPNWNNMEDRMLYKKLFYHDNWEKLTEQEQDFCKTMYHFEEYVSGLDGDRN